MEANEINALIGRSVRKCRNEAKITQNELGEMVGMSKNNVARIERGEVGISIKFLFEIAKALKVSPAVLVVE